MNATKAQWAASEMADDQRNLDYDIVSESTMENPIITGLPGCFAIPFCPDHRTGFENYEVTP